MSTRFALPVRLLLVNQFAVNTGFYLLIPYLAGYLGGRLGLSAALVGVVLGVRNLSQQGLFLIGGTAADRFGARNVIIAGCALRAVGFGLFALGTSLPVLLAASVLSGLAVTVSGVADGGLMRMILITDRVCAGGQGRSMHRSRKEQAPSSRHPRS